MTEVETSNIGLVMVKRQFILPLPWWKCLLPFSVEFECKFNLRWRVYSLSKPVFRFGVGDGRLMREVETSAFENVMVERRGKLCSVCYGNWM